MTLGTALALVSDVGVPPGGDNSGLGVKVDVTPALGAAAKHAAVNHPLTTLIILILAVLGGLCFWLTAWFFIRRSSDQKDVRICAIQTVEKLGLPPDMKLAEIRRIVSLRKWRVT